ncbi:Polynucleotide 5'-hydroxyl-kinase grc3 [Coemansia sp. Cherry 401B]|nr:Polynucleotide 5'-hydroxyl-kinase grc3 [Coemansia sp. RSA 2704]KAJ2738921.1 Polynucleotide 5'-hydroxyl-kinase grc3 [Coemansia sp. Cherry 401B]
MEALTSRRSTRVYTPRSRTPRSPTGSPTPARMASSSPPVAGTSWTAEHVMAVGRDSTDRLVEQPTDTPGRYATVFSMRAGEAIAFVGIVDVCVLQGTATVYEQCVGARWQRVYSPTSHPLASIRAISDDKESGEADDGEIDAIRALWAQRAGGVVVVVRTVQCGLESLGRVSPHADVFKLRPLAQRLRAQGGAEDSDVEAEVRLNAVLGMPGFAPVLYVTTDLQLLRVPTDWTQVLERSAQAPVQLNAAFAQVPPVYVVTGAQGLGKSTFARLLTNQLVSRFGQAFHMEADLGQSEFAAPGALTLNLLDSAVCGPPFAHVGQREPYHAVYLGAVTPKNDPDRYAAGVAQLARAYHEYPAGDRVVPLVVNTQGWVRGLGLDLLYTLCEHVRPTHYVQIHDMQGDGQPLLDFDALESCDPQVTLVSAVGGDLAAGRGQRLAAPELRTLALLSHLYQAESTSVSGIGGMQHIERPVWASHVALAARRPLAVPLSDLIVWLGDEDVAASQLPRALNGTLAGLVCVARAPGVSAHEWSDAEIRGLRNDSGLSDQAAAELSEQGARILLRSQAKDLSIPHVVYGHPNLRSTTFTTHVLVRSIDVSAGVAYLVLPPIASALLDRVIGLVKGPGAGAFGIEVPAWAMVDGGYRERAMGASAAANRRPRRLARAAKRQKFVEQADETNVGIQEAPYLSVEVDEGVGAATMRSHGGQMRRALQQP